mmetsp:Transcript_29368/g.78885  ORF Transcript_29368/g.78885 Transcript_29368/m.78885 type:complete len:372 (-) Transcript_29368:133-1248(-)
MSRAQSNSLNCGLCSLCRLVLGDDAHGLEVIEHALEHKLRVHRLMEASLPDLGRVRHDVELVAPAPVGKSPVAQVLKLSRLEVVLGHDAIPHGSLVLHGLHEVHGLDALEGNAKVIRKLGPHVVPSEEVAVDYVERLIGRSVRSGCPLTRSREVGCVAHLCELVEGSGLAGKGDGLSELLHDGAVHGNADDEVHLPCGVAAHDVRADGNPLPRARLRTGLHVVLLRVVEVVLRGPRIVLLGRRLELAQVHAVVLEALVEQHALELGRVLVHCVHNVLEQGHVGLHVVRAARGESTEEDVRHIGDGAAAELGVRILDVEEVHLDRGRARLKVGVRACHDDHLGPLRLAVKVLHEGAANDALADDEGHLGVGG